MRVMVETANTKTDFSKLVDVRTGSYGVTVFSATFKSCASMGRKERLALKQHTKRFEIVFIAGSYRFSSKWTVSTKGSFMGDVENLFFSPKSGHFVIPSNRTHKFWALLRLDSLFHHLMPSTYEVTRFDKMCNESGRAKNEKAPTLGRRLFFGSGQPLLPLGVRVVARLVPVGAADVHLHGPLRLGVLELGHWAVRFGHHRPSTPVLEKKA
jgi:hypothetical protein